MLVMFSALLVLGYTMFSGLSAVGFSRQRTEATALANQALEKIRALPGSQLYLSASDIGSDSQLTACAGGTCFNGRKVPTANYASTPVASPLVPHITTATALPGTTVYTIKSYVSIDPNDTTGHTLIATVQVSWSGSQIGGVGNSVQVESKLYSSQYNEAAPAVHSFLANATGGPGTITVSGTVLGSNLLNVSFNMPSTSAQLSGTSIPGTTNVGASGTPVSASIAQSGITAGSVSVMNTAATTASAQSAANASPAGQTSTATPTVLNTLSSTLGVDLGTLSGSASAGSSESASAEAASSANGTTPTSGSPTLPSNGLGYGRGTASQSGVIGANLNVSALVNLLGIGLVSLTPTGNTTPDYATVAQNGTASAPGAQTYTASADQQFSELDVLNITAAGAQLLGGPLIKLTGFQQSISACAGPGTCGASGSTDTGSISILGGTPISVQNLLDGAVPVSTLNSLISGVSFNLAGLTTLTVTGTGISVGSVATATTVPAPLSISLHASANLAGVNLLNVDITVTLGSVSASASYS